MSRAGKHLRFSIFSLFSHLLIGLHLKEVLILPFYLLKKLSQESNSVVQLKGKEDCSSDEFLSVSPEKLNSIPPFEA